jgi:heat shock protein HslJ
MTRLTTFSLTIATAIAVAACSSSGASTAPTPAALDLNGHTYLSTGSTGVTLVPGTQVTITFKDANLSASAGCNSMGGAYKLEGDHLTTAQMITTEMGCAAPLMAQDQWLAKFLTDVRLAQDGATLTMTQGATTLTLLDKTVATPDKPIEGTLWILDAIASGGAASSIPQGVVSTLRIVDGKAEVDTGCNTGGGDVTVTGDSLTFGPLVLTKKACQADTAAVEAAVTKVLTGTVVYEIDADALVLQPRADGLIYRATP